MPKVLPNIKDKILTQAEELIYQHGFEETEMREIARHCNIAVGTLYRYFDNKDDLITHVLEHHCQELMQSMEEVVSSDEEPQKRLQMLVSLLLADISKIYSAHHSMSGPAGIKEDHNIMLFHTNAFKNIYDLVTGYFHQVITDMIPHPTERSQTALPERLSRLVFAMVLDSCMLPENQQAGQAELISDMLGFYLLTSTE